MFVVSYCFINTVYLQVTSHRPLNQNRSGSRVRVWESLSGRVWVYLLRVGSGLDPKKWPESKRVTYCTKICPLPHPHASALHFCLRNDLYCVGWGVKLYSLTHSLACSHQCLCICRLRGTYRIIVKSFSVAGPTSWNSLPDRLREFWQFFEQLLETRNCL